MSTGMDEAEREALREWQYEQEQLAIEEEQARQTIEAMDDQWDDDPFIDDDPWEPEPPEFDEHISGSLFITPTDLQPAWDNFVVMSNEGVLMLKALMVEKVKVGVLNFVQVEQGEIVEVYGHG